MAHAFVPGLEITPFKTILVERLLPVAGSLTVRPGQTVASTDIVGRAERPGELHLLRLPERMGLEPYEVMEGLKVRVGDQVRPGTLICEHKALFNLLRSRFTSEITGTVELITEQTGHVAIRSPANPIELTAYVSGTVKRVIEGKGVQIETNGAFVQGIFGIGGERIGRIKILDIPASAEVTEGAIPDDCAGRVLVGGTHPTLAALRRAEAAGATGLVVGGMDDRALAGYLGYDLGIALTGDENVKMTLVITEGFGNLPLSSRVLDVLRPLDGMAVSINGATQVRAGALRPEIIVPIEEKRSLRGQAETPESKQLRIGCPIRLIRVPFFGLQGRVVELPPEAQRIETGAFARVLVAELGDGRRVTVPRANVELI